MRWVPLMLLVVVGCAGRGPARPAPTNPVVVMQPNSTKGLADLVQHFRQEGLQGEYTPALPGTLGAGEAGVLVGPEVDVSLLKFDDVEKAHQAEERGAGGQAVYRNGVFLMIIRKGDAKALPAFSKF